MQDINSFSWPKSQDNIWSLLHRTGTAEVVVCFLWCLNGLHLNEEATTMREWWKIEISIPLTTVCEISFRPMGNLSSDKSIEKNVVDMLNNCSVLFCKWSNVKKSYRWQSSWLWNAGFCLLVLRWWRTHRCPSHRASPRGATDCSSLQIWPYDPGWGTSSCSPPCLSLWCPGLSRCEAVQKHISVARNLIPRVTVWFVLFSDLIPWHGQKTHGVQVITRTLQDSLFRAVCVNFLNACCCGAMQQQQLR